MNFIRIKKIQRKNIKRKKVKNKNKQKQLTKWK